MSHLRWTLLLLFFPVAFVTETGQAHAEVVRMEVTHRQPFAEGISFGAVGPYEVLRGRIYAEVDPHALRNQHITDLQLAPRNDRGKVEYWSDFVLLKPVDPLRGNRRLLYDVNNRGNLVALWTFNGAEMSNVPLGPEHAGDGFLMHRGYSVFWCGWNGDVMEDGRDRLRVGLPVARQETGPVSGQVHIEVSVDEPTRSWTFGWSPWGVADAYGSVDMNDPQATLTMRPRRSAPGEIVPRDQWAFARWEDGRLLPDPKSIYLPAGLKPGWLYDVVYTAQAPRVAGLGPAAIRDAVSFLRYSEESPLHESVEHAYLFGISQSGRLCNYFLYAGLNADPRNRLVFDGALIHVAGAGRGLFNSRFGLATRYGSPHRENLTPSEEFPFHTVPQYDPVTGQTGEILATLRESGHLPKIFYVQSSTEYWARGASLLHTDVEGRRDVEVDPHVRIYLTSGSQHLGQGPHTRGVGQQPRNILDDRTPILRNLLVALDRWVGNGVSPPESRYPRMEDGTLVTVAEFRNAFPAIPGVNKPQGCYTPVRLDFGPRWRKEGIADFVPPKLGEPYRTLVPQVDADGNELAGIRLPDVSVPLGTYCGWNLRAPEFGAEDMLTDHEGSYLPFPLDVTERQTKQDPRAAILERYPTQAIYLNAYTQATLRLQAEGYLLPEDALKLIRTASQRDYWKTGE